MCLTQDFQPAPNTYDVIWIQWVIGHLHDLDFIRFFRRCAVGLKPGQLLHYSAYHCVFIEIYLCRWLYSVEGQCGGG